MTEQVNAEKRKSDQNDIYPPEPKVENMAPSCDEAIDSTSDAPKELPSNVVQEECNPINSNKVCGDINQVEKEKEITSNGLIESFNQVRAIEEDTAPNGLVEEKVQVQEELPNADLTVVRHPCTDENDEITGTYRELLEQFEATTAPQEYASDDLPIKEEIQSILNVIKAEADLVQSGELTSSTEPSELQPQIVEQLVTVEQQPLAMEQQESMEQPVKSVDQPDSVEQPEIIVSIPLEALDENLQRRLCLDPETEESLNRESATPKELPVQPDDVNNNENDENFCQSATADSFNSAVALRTHQIEALPPGETESDADEVPVVRSGPTPMDFMAEFAKHCANGVEQLKATTPVASPTPSDLLPLNDLDAKQKLEVEMNDVENTLNGILNEMQDQHMYTPTCAHIDEFLTPADYAPMTEQETSVSSPPNPFEHSPRAEPEAKPNASDDPFDNSNFSSELIGFQNDIPCFENIETTTEQGQNLHLELTQFLRDLQPAQPNQLPGEQCTKTQVETHETVQMQVQASNLQMQHDIQSQNASADPSPNESPISSPQVGSQIEIQMEPEIENQLQHEILTVQSPQQNHPEVQSHDQSQIPPQIEPHIQVQNHREQTLQIVPHGQQQVVAQVHPQMQLQSQIVPHVQTRGTTTTVTYEQIYQQHIVQQTVQQSHNKMQVISLPSGGSERRQWKTQQSQQQQQLQWSTVGGLEAIKSAPVESVSPTTTTYYISAGDLYPQQGDLFFFWFL